jgi:hypothetical protein
MIIRDYGVVKLDVIAVLIFENGADMGYKKAENSDGVWPLNRTGPCLKSHRAVPGDWSPKLNAN